MVSFPCASAVRGGGRGGGGSGGSAFCTTRIKVSQNCCESGAGATQSTRCARKELFLRELITWRSGAAEGYSQALPPLVQAADLAGHTPMRPAPEPQGSWKIFHQNFQGKYLISLKTSACFYFILLGKLNMENGKDISRNPETLMAGEGDSIHFANEKLIFFS